MKKHYLSLLFIALSTLTLVAQVPSYVPTNGLVGWWPFNGNANDLSGNGNNGTVNGATLTTDRFGSANSAYSFDGLTNYIQPNLNSINNTIGAASEISTSIWVKTSDLNGPLVSFQNGAGIEYDIHIGTLADVVQSAGNFGILVRDNCCGTGNNIFGNNVSNNQWTNIVIVRLGSGVLQLYNNGNLISTSGPGQNGALPFNPTYMAFGADLSWIIGATMGCMSCNTPNQRYLNGLLDDIAIWNRALTQAEVTALYTSTPPPTPPTVAITPASTSICAGTSTTLSATATAGSTVCSSSQLPTSLQSGLVGYWPFCGNANDESGNGNNGTVNGATLTTDRFGNASSAYSFDGNDWIEMTVPNLPITNNQRSVSVWTNVLNSNPTNKTAIHYGNNTYNNRFALLYTNSNNLAVIGESNDACHNCSGTTNYSGSTATPGVWQHIVVNFDGNYVTVYIDGAISFDAPKNFNTLLSVLRIGKSIDSHLSGEYFSGKIDDIGIWNRTLTASEIQQLYTAGAATYSWSPGGATTPSITVSPTATTTYTCTATANGVSASASSVVTVLPAPTITATNTAICAGQSTTLTAAASGSTGSSACPTLSGTLNSGLVGYWPFCGNANDASGNGNNGTVNGATLTTDRFGNANSAYSFDGVNDYIQCLQGGPTGNTTRTISFWLKTTSTTPGSIFSYGTIDNNPGQDFRVILNSTCQGIAVSITGAGKDAAYTANNIWDFFTITFDNNVSNNLTAVNIYKNGILQNIYCFNSGNSLINSSTSLPITFGRYHWLQYTGNNQYLEGNLDDLGLWNRLLTASEIQQLYTQGQTTYSWSPGGATTPSITVSPTSTTTYTCTVTDGNGNSCSQDQLITVNPTPTVNAGADLAVCNGSTATLTATGAATYSWTNSVQNGVAFTPIATTTYTVTGTDANGCTGTDAVTVTLVPTPTISATNATVCAGQSTTLTATASGSTGSTACPTLSGTLSSGLVGFWPFCGNANDASGNGNNGTVNGATLTTDRFGNANSAYSFDGVDDVIEVIHNSIFNFGINPSFSMSLWINKQISNAGGIICKAEPFNGYNWKGWNFINDDFQTGYPCLGNNSSSSLSIWNNYSIVVSNGLIQIYINNILTNQFTCNQLTSSNISTINNLFFGVDRDGNNFYSGKLDDIAIWNRALTSSEIQELYTSTATTYSWSPGGATTPSITVSPTTTTTYTCTVTDGNGNSCAATQTIAVIPFTAVDAGPDQTICAGGSATLSATGASSYTWNNSVQNGVAFTPLATSSYIVTGTQNGCTDADTVLVTVVADPTITSPVAASYCQNGGTVAPLSVSIAGGIGSTNAFQWYANTTVNNFGGTPVLGATSSTYTPPINTVGTTFYYCTVTQGAAGNGCLATSGANSIVVNAQPTITSQPVASQNGCIGANLNNLSVTTTGGSGGAAYQWYTNSTASTSGGTAINGANAAAYAPSSAAAGNVYYYAIVSFPSAATSCAQATTQIANVNIINDPVFTQVPPANQTVCIGGTIPALTISTSGGSGTASYQWYLVNGNTYTTILGATSPSYTPPAFNLPGNYAYAVGMTQTLAGCGTGFSTLANVSVVADPSVSTPTGASYCQGGLASAPLTVIATGGINAGFTYQWFSNGSNNNTTGIPISGANAASYTPPTNTIGNLYYYCLVNQGSGCQASSAPAAIQVGPGPALTAQPIASQTVCAGASLNALSVAYSGGVGTPAFQWYSSTTNNNFGGTPVAGATNANFTPNPNVVGLNYYYCQVSFAALTTCSSITSNVAQVNVISNPVFSSSPLTSQTICQGSGAQTLSFATSGGAGTTSYQWYNVNGSNYTPILGATGLTYTPPTNLPVGTYNYAVAMNQVASGCSTGFSANSELVILAQPVVSTPVGGVYCQGGTIGQALSVSVSGGLGASTYQWYQHTISNNSGGIAIAQATSSTYTPSLSNLGTLYYYCVVTQNAGCASSSAVAAVVSNPSPVISTQPIANQTICTGATPSSLSVSYTGGVGAVSYQWYFNAQNSNVGGTPITGATLNTYIPSNFNTVGSSFYYCVVSLSNSSCPIITSNVAAVNAVANPTVNGPLNATYCQSTSVAQPLSVVANGGTSNNYTYQWYSNASNANFGGNPILGANNASYTPNINGSSTYYYCVVSQAGGCQTASAPAAVTIVSNPSFSSQALSPQSVCIGGTPQVLSIAIIGGVSNPSFQWYSNTVNTSTNASLIPNASSATYAPNIASNTGTTYYFCQVSFTANSACPTLTSNAAIVNAVADPVVSSPNSASYCQNATSVAPLSVTASGGINTSYTYQWYSNTTNSTIGGTPIAGANTNTYVPLVNQIGNIYYYCEVTQGSGCTALSGVSTISVGTAVSINQQPISSQNLCLGQNASLLTVGVTAGNYALSYQWYSNVTNNNFGGSVIVGATNAFYNPPSNALGTKYYYCVIAIAGGGCGNLTSNTAAITVLNAPTMFQPNSQTVCCQSSTTPINFVGNASSYSWTASSSSPLLTGFSSAGNGNIPSNVLTNNSTTPQNIVYLVTPSNQGCAGTPVQFNISVLPCMSVSVPSDQYYCAGESVPAYVFSGVGQTYSWVNTNTTIGLQNAGINFVPNFVAQNNTATTQVATITVTPNFMGCAGTPQSYSISVYPLPLVDAGLDQEICSGGSVTLTANGAPNLVWDNGILNGQTFVPNATTTYTVTGTDNNGCQNSDAVVVTVNSPTSATLNATTCDAYTLNGQTYTASGTYSQLLSNSEGCDSTLTLNLTVNFSPNQPNIYVQNQVNLSTDLVPGLTYQWITCSDLTPISGQTAITYNPTSNGVYAVVVTNGCGSDTSLCTSITTIGLEEHLSSQILLYPNPNNGVFTLEMPQALIGQTIQIFDMAGRLIQESTAQEMKQHIELKDVATGSYWLRIGGETPMKLVKN